MRNKYMITAIICCALFLLLPALPKQLSLVSVFRVTEEPAVIVRGASGSALTVNISFGDIEVEQWIRELSKPYPLLLVDMKWAGRFPETVQLIKEKNISVGLLGDKGITYEQNTPLFIEQLEQFEKTVRSKTTLVPYQLTKFSQPPCIVCSGKLKLMHWVHLLFGMAATSLLSLKGKSFLSPITGKIVLI